jgi:HTH-type transcriptional regulator/antitoxin HigA
MLSAKVRNVVDAWPAVSSVLFVPHTKADYKRAVNLLDELIDEVGENEDHPLASLMETLGTLVESYEDQHFPEPQGDPISSLKEFMTDHHLQPGDLPELGDAKTVHELLDRKRELTPSQIRALSERFGVSALVFI